jgi:hypothetical protein
MAIDGDTDGEVKRVLLPLALVAVAGLLSACGVRSTVDPVASAASKSQQAGGVKVDMTIAVDAAGRSFTMGGSGTFDSDEGQMTFDMSSLLQASHMPAGAGTDMKEIYLKENGDPVVYMEMPFLAGMVPGGKTWIRLDLERLGSAAGVDFNQLLGQSNQNPAQSLDMLRAAGQVTEIDSDEIAGVPVTKYHATVDLNKALALRGISASAIQRLLDAGAPTDVPVDVWIGKDDGLVRRLQISYDLTESGRSVSTQLTLDLSDWGTDVSVQAPPADQVFDATDLATNANKS